jgi:predicted RNA-binding protein YlqC (UPF0109 family)
MSNVVLFTEELIKGLVMNPDIVSVQAFEEDDMAIIEIIVHNDDISHIIGKSGTMIKAIKTLINACCYKNNIHKVKVNIDSI